MIITKKALPRRTVLRGIGATIALPLLDGMVPAYAALRTTAARPTPRLGIVYVPMGAVMDNWTPATEGAGFALSPILQPLAPMRDQLLVLTGLDNQPAVALPGEPAGGHGRIGAAFLTGVHAKPTEGVDFRAGVSIDQIAGAELGRDTQLASLEVGLETTELAGACDVGYSCAYVNTLCWRSPTTPLPMENNPRAVFERLFGDSDSTDPAARAARLRRNRSLLDSVQDGVIDQQRDLGTRDRARLTEYLDAIRDVERRIQTAEAQRDRELPTFERPAGSIPERFEDYAKIMIDLQVLAFESDMTRVITFMIGKELSSRTFPELGVPDQHHPLSHHQNNPEKLEKLTRVQVFHAGLLAYYLERLASTPDGDGSLLDQMTLLYGSGMSNSNLHIPLGLPILVAGGGAGTLKGGRHIRLSGGHPAGEPVPDLAEQARCPGGADRRQHRGVQGALRGLTETDSPTPAFGCDDAGNTGRSQVAETALRFLPLPLPLGEGRGEGQRVIMRDRVVRCALVVTLAGLSPVYAQQGAPDGQWPTYGGDHGSTKYAPLDQIDRETVADLEVVWRWESPDNAIVTANRTTLPTLPAAFKATPILVDGVLYIKTSMSQAAAIDAETGETLWVFDPGSWEDERPANTGYNARGVAYWSDGQESRIFLPTGNAYLWAVDARTGRPIANFGADGAIDATQGLRRPIERRAYQLMSAPLVVGDVIVLGSVVSDGPRYQLAPPGDVRGFDARTGRELWEFHTIPQPGEFGNDTWENDSWRDTGAANAWGLLTADPELGYVYIPTGTPTNDYYGGHRLGDNLYAESIVCLDARTGEVIWHFQFVHHGLWDYDATAAPLLVDLVVDGRPVKAVAVVTKQAFTYVFDRVTGEPLWPIEERPVAQSTVPGEQSSPTQPFPTKPPPFDRQGVTIDGLIYFTPELRAEAVELLNEFVYGPLFEPITAEGDGKRGTIIMPGAGGGANWHGAAVDPETGWLYVPSRTAPSVMQLAPPDPSRSDFRYNRGRPGRARGPQGLPLWKPPYVRFSAFDLNDGTLEWMVPLGDGPRQRVIDLGAPDPGPLGGGSYTGPLLTRSLLFLGFRGRGDASDLDFRPAANRTLAPRAFSRTPTLLAFDKTTGETVHAVELGVAPTGTPMTYLLNGTQYIVLAYGTANDAGLLALATTSRFAR